MAEAPDITPETAALLTRQILDKSKRDTPRQGIEFASVVAIAFDEGLVPMATVAFAGDPPGESRVVPCLTGVAPAIGARVACIWDPPAGCYIIGTPDLSIVPVGRLSLACGGKPT